VNSFFKRIAILIVFSAVIYGVWALADARETPKNIIVMIGDGMGFEHVEAARLYQYGDDSGFAFQSFPVAVAMSTFPVDGSYDPEETWSDFDHRRHRPTDSAASGTAMATGTKTENGRIGMTKDGEYLGNIIQVAEARQKSTGIVTSVLFSHATPAAYVAHNEKRSHYEDIAREMLFNSGVDVIMGAGHPYYDNSGQPEDSPSFKYVGGEESWQAIQNGSAGCDADGDEEKDLWTLVEERVDVQRLATGNTPERLLVVPRVYQTLQASRDGDRDALPFAVSMNDSIPTLEEMTEAALNRLDNDPDGFFLMVEGGAVDWASHDNHSGRMIEEMMDFTRTIDSVIKWVEGHGGWSETLLIVTADHECGYLTGPNSGPAGEEDRTRPVWNPVIGRGAGALPEMEWHSGSHTNALVPFYAIGTGSRQLEDTADQEDPVAGRYLDNAELGHVLKSFWTTDSKHKKPTTD
jgi:alkaline phosphatase